MDFEIQQAVELVRNLLWLKTADLSPADRQDADKITDKLLTAAFQDVGRLSDDWATEVRARDARIIEAQEQAARDVITAEEQAARDAVQAEADIIQRDERQRAGVS